MEKVINMSMSIPNELKKVKSLTVVEFEKIEEAYRKTLIENLFLVNDTT